MSSLSDHSAMLPTVTISQPEWHTVLTCCCRHSGRARQALEKYIKAILLFRRIPCTKRSHSLTKLLEMLHALPVVIFFRRAELYHVHS